MPRRPWMAESGEAERPAALLVAQVEQPHFAPRALQPIPPRSLRGHAEC
jgi:hypothetical protein